MELLDVNAEQLHPVQSPVMDLGQLWPQAGGVRLRFRADCCEILSERADLPQGPLDLDRDFQIGELTLRLVQTRPSALLQGLNEPQRGQVWNLGARSLSLIGRSGKRINHVTLEEPTVSRAHACLSRQGETYSLQIESSAASFLNGMPLSPGQPAILKDGDLIRLGNALLAFYQPRVRAPHKPKLRIYSLGRFEVQLEAVQVRADQWRSHLSRYLLAYLAAEWPSAVAIERLLEMFWPEMEPERARHNLRTALTNLRSHLKLAPQAALLARTTHAIEFDPSLEVWHDLTELRRLLSQAQQSTGLARQKLQAQALELYRGKYLEDCYFEFAERVRGQLELQLLAVACDLLTHFSELQNWGQVLQVGQQALGLDSCCQEAYLAVMKAARALGRPEEAVRWYENCKRALQRELAVEPNVEIEREHQLARFQL